MEFDPRIVNEYSIEELMQFIESGKVSFSDLQKCGLNWQMQERIKNELARIEIEEKKQEEVWQVTCNLDMRQAYEYYLNQFGDDAMRALEAKLKISSACVYGPPIVDSYPFKDLIDDMRENMLSYKANVMMILFGKIPATDEMRAENTPIGRFLKANMKLTFQDLYNSGILPEGNHALEKAIFIDDFEVPRLTMFELGEVPTDRTDVYFVGCPGSGKSCVLAGLLNYLHYASEMKYMPNKNARGLDGCRPYYNALIRCLSEYKVPHPRVNETVCFMQLDLGAKRDRKVTVMELSGKAFKLLSDANFKGHEIWDQLGAGTCLKNNNPKTLFFLLDYGSIIGKNPCYSAVDQAQILENALNVFCSDGSGKNNEKGCTMSKVRTVAIVITKSDLMDIEAGRQLTPEERNDIAVECLNKHCAGFLNILRDVCRKYRIKTNNNKDYEPFITAFSLGKFYVGNNVVYDPTDSKRLAEFIMAAVEKRHRSLFDFLK